MGAGSHRRYTIASGCNKRMKKKTSKKKISKKGQSVGFLKGVIRQIKHSRKSVTILRPGTGIVTVISRVA